MQWVEPVIDRTSTYSKSNYMLNGTDLKIVDENGIDILVFVDKDIVSWNYMDVNRIELDCEFLASQFNLYDYPINITVKTDWTLEDFPYEIEVNRIRDNINTLLTAYYTVNGSPIIVYHNTLNWTDINTLEQNLKNMYTLLESMIDSFKYSGTFNSGQEVIL